MPSLGLRSQRRRYAAVLAAVVALSCRSPSHTIGTPVKSVGGGQPRDTRIHTLLLNGGGRREINYRSHLQHVKTLLALLTDAHIKTHSITVFSGDGADPAADLATREPTTESGFWILPSDSFGRALRPPIEYVDSAVEGMRLRPAKKDALRAWFEQDGARLRARDTLLFYVTDHGDKNDKDLTNNTITLWGETLTVSELRDLFALLDPEVRVVMLMSQCYAGSFANVIFAGDGSARPQGKVCGYFAATADRPAYGCYPENRGKDGVGHSHHFFEALADLGGFQESHRRVLVTDRTPDVPHTSGDFYLEQLLRKAAAASNRELQAVVDERLAEAWQDRAAWEPEIRLLDRIGHSFGSFSPRSLAELEEYDRMLPEFSKRLGTYADRWEQTLESLKIENMARFIDAEPSWRDRIPPKELAKLEPEKRRATTTELLDALLPFTGRDAARHARLLSLKRKADDASAASYRAEVRLGVVLRMRALLTSIAGRVQVARHETPEVREAYERIVACEDLTLNPKPRVASAAVLDSPESFPPLADEQRLVESLMPAYMGIQFRPLPETQQRRYGTKPGAVTVITLNPDSPAEAAGLKLGDIILGPPDSPFTEPNQVREWTMLREIDAPAPLDVLRNARAMRVTLHPGPYPLELPQLPGPPKVGSLAPSLEVDLFRGGTRLAQDKPRLLYFWATWCLICKHALPELLAFGQARGTEIVAITDEEPEILKRYFRESHEPFPSIVAIDPYRKAFQSYGVSGTPTFVLVDAKNVVRHYQAGYTRERGLHVDGWTWPRGSDADARAADARPGEAAGATPGPTP